MVTGGVTSLLDEIFTVSTEVFTDGSGWTSGPDLTYAMSSHCQVQTAETVFVIGNKYSSYIIANKPGAVPQLFMCTLVS